MKTIPSQAKKPKKSQTRRYRPLSFRRRMKRLREAKFFPSTCNFLPLFRNRKFLFPFQPNSPLDFCQLFVKRFVFPTQFSDREIPSPFCPHVLVPSSLINDLLHDSDMLCLVHRFYYTSQNRFEGRLAEDFYQEVGFSLKRGYAKKSKILPFVVASPDFIEDYEEANEDEIIIVEVKSSESIEEIDKILSKENKQVEVQALVTKSVFGATSVRISCLKKSKSLSCPFKICGSVFYQSPGDFILQNKKTLISKYLSNLLMPYFKNEFKITLNDVESQIFIKWFTSCLQNEKSLKKSQICDRSLNKTIKTQKHWNCRSIAKYAAFYSNKEVIKYL